MMLIRGWWLYRLVCCCNSACCCCCCCWWWSMADDWRGSDWVGAVVVDADGVADEELLLRLLLCGRKSTAGYRWIGVTIDLPPKRRGWCPNPIPFPPDNEADTRARPKPQDCDRLSIQKCMPHVWLGVLSRGRFWRIFVVVCMKVINQNI